MLLTLITEFGEVVFVPMLDDRGRITWTCTNGEGLSAGSVPSSCRGTN
jgi:hypothetical protein